MKDGSRGPAARAMRVRRTVGIVCVLRMCHQRASCDRKVEGRGGRSRLSWWASRVVASSHTLFRLLYPQRTLPVLLLLPSGRTPSNQRCPPRSCRARPSLPLARPGNSAETGNIVFRRLTKTCSMPTSSCGTLTPTPPQSLLARLTTPWLHRSRPPGAALNSATVDEVDVPTRARINAVARRPASAGAPIEANNFCSD